MYYDIVFIFHGILWNWANLRIVSTSGFTGIEFEWREL